MTTNDLPSVQALCNHPHPYETSADLDKLFIKAMIENIQWHRQRSSFYKRFLEDQNFSTEKLKTIDDCASIPYLPAEFFKHHEVVSIKRDDVFVHLTSSGTSGQKSQMFFDKWSLQSAQQMVDFIFKYYRWETLDAPANYLLYTYEPKAGLKLGTAYTDNFLCKFAPVNDAFYALQNTGKGGHDFDLFGCIRQLQNYASKGLPLRILGFPSFLWFTLQRMRDLGLPPLQFSDQSLVFLGGGWKGYAHQEISKKELYAQVNAQLGIPDHRIRDGYGSVEHCIPYIECRNHQFHVPTWSRVYIHDVKTLDCVGYDQPGFLHFVSPYITSVPAQSVLMGDLASLHAADSCSCELGTPYFKVLGRAGTSQNKSCAIAAAELLKGFA